MLRRVLLGFVFAILAASPAFSSPLVVTIDLQMQTMHVRVDGVTKHRWDISSGREGFDTPPGRYRPTRMYKEYYSKQYDNAPMPYSVFFHQGYAIHGTTALDRLGTVASHGCVRLDPANAKLLFALVQKVGMLKTVIRVRPYAQGLAQLAPPTPGLGAPPPIMVAEAEDATAIDPAETGSIGPTPVPWLRGGR